MVVHGALQAPRASLWPHTPSLQASPLAPAQAEIGTLQAAKTAAEQELAAIKEQVGDGCAIAALPAICCQGNGCCCGPLVSALPPCHRYWCASHSLLSPPGPSLQSQSSQTTNKWKEEREAKKEADWDARLKEAYK